MKIRMKKKAKFFLYNSSNIMVDLRNKKNLEIEI